MRYGNWVHQFNVLARASAACESRPNPWCWRTTLRRTAADGMTLAEFDARSDQLDEEYFDFVAPSGYVPHLPELEPN